MRVLIFKIMQYPCKKVFGSHPYAIFEIRAARIWINSLKLHEEMAFSSPQKGDGRRIPVGFPAREAHDIDGSDIQRPAYGFSGRILQCKSGYDQQGCRENSKKGWWGKASSGQRNACRRMHKRSAKGTTPAGRMIIEPGRSGEAFRYTFKGVH